MLVLCRFIAFPLWLNLGIEAQQLFCKFCRSGILKFSARVRNACNNLYRHADSVDALQDSDILLRLRK